MKYPNKMAAATVIFIAAIVSLNAHLSVSAQFPIRIPSPRTQPAQRPSSPQTNTPRQTSSGGNQDEMRRNFINEFGKYRKSVYALMQVHDPKLHVGNTSYGPPTSKSQWVNVMAELAEIDAACKSKYAGMTDTASQIEIGELNRLPATWWTIAANRIEYEKKGKISEVARSARKVTEQITRFLRNVENEPEERIGLEAQLMFWETNKWKASIFTKLQPMFAEFDMEVPDDFLDEYINSGYALRDKRIKTGESRSFQLPPYKNTAVETWFRSQYQRQTPGIKILKMGSSYSECKIFKNRAGIPTSRTKRGWALLQIPDRPICQAREWIVKQDYAGGGRYTGNKIDSLGATGILMKCQ